MRRVLALIVVALVCFPLVCFPLAMVASPADVESRRKALNDLLAERWEYQLRTSPEYASILGDKRWNDKLSDGSQKAIDDDLARAKADLAKFEDFRLSEQGALNRRSTGPLTANSSGERNPGNNQTPIVLCDSPLVIRPILGRTK